MSSINLTDAHSHVLRADASRHIICSPYDASIEKNEGDVFFEGVHPWYLDDWDGGDKLRQKLKAKECVGVGEIGLDRLRSKEISSKMREVLEAQLKIASEFDRPVVLHGAKCWGEVVKECKKYASKIPSFLFHGFSRSGGLIPYIERLNGFISVGPAILNNHAINYRELVKSIPLNMLLVESDATLENKDEVPSLLDIVRALAGVRGVSLDELCDILETNLSRFIVLI